MEFAANMTIVSILGGMIAFQLLFAPLIFIKLEMSIARSFIRAFFPYYYLYFAALCVIGLVLAFVLQTWLDAVILGGCLLGFLVSRQILMPRANAATDSGNKKQFDLFHRLTVLINTLQMLAITYLVYV